MLRVNNIPLLKYHTDRLRQSKLPIIIATTTNSADDIISGFAECEEISCHRGSEDDVLSRYYEAALKYKLDVVVRVTSDCPLVDGKLIGESVKKYLGWNNEDIYFSNSIIRTFPRGFDAEIFSFRLLEEAFQKAKLPSEREHVTPYIKANYSGKVRFEHILYEYDASNFRITVDTPEDFELIKILIEKYSAQNLSYIEIIELLKVHPELVRINAHIEQKKI